MLVELQVEGFAVVERLRIRFGPGLNLLTGETGSGKSLVVEALGLLFGARATNDQIRSGAKRARIAGIFEGPDDASFRGLLEESGIEVEDGELLLEREVQASGKSRAFAGSRPVTVSLLRDMAPYLGDIHGQHAQQRLFEPDTQLEMLDDFAGHFALIEQAREVFGKWREIGRRLAELDSSEQERLRMTDLWSFQRNEIEEAAPQAGEDEALERERKLLGNVARLEENIGGAYAGLYESEGAAVSQIRKAWRQLDEVAAFDANLGPIRDRLQQAEIAVEEAANDLRQYLGRLEADPARLDAVEARLASLEKLKRKYGRTIEQVLTFLGEVCANLAVSESAEERREHLSEELDRVASEFRAVSQRLTKSRTEAARQMERLFEAELRSLAMERTVFRVEITPAAWSASGADGASFLVSPNPGEEPRPLEKVASGGELSRIALALKAIVAARVLGGSKASSQRTLVFDEVDAGVGGGAAEAVGRRLKQLAQADQVLCVTHLPQIAGFADHHYTVEKRAAKGRTVVSVSELVGEARTREIGRMLSGHKLTEEALRNAERLIRLAAG